MPYIHIYIFYMDWFAFSLYWIHIQFNYPCLWPIFRNSIHSISNFSFFVAATSRSKLFLLHKSLSHSIIWYWDVISIRYAFKMPNFLDHVAFVIHIFSRTWETITRARTHACVCNHIHVRWNWYCGKVFRKLLYWFLPLTLSRKRAFE